MSETSQNTANDHERHDHAKLVSITVNARRKSVPKGEISFEAVVELAFPSLPSSDLTVYTVDYRKGEGDRQSGSLTIGHSVRVKEDMIFNVVPTDKS